MPLVQFGEYRPDVSDYEGQSTQTIENVVPRGDGYGPLNSVAFLSEALPAQCRGGFYALNKNGSVTIFAATSTRLYKLNATQTIHSLTWGGVAMTWGDAGFFRYGSSWQDVSKGHADYPEIVSTDQWQFRQFGNFIIAVNGSTPPQVFNLTSSSEFDDLAGSPPTARYIDIVGRFVVLSGLISEPYRIQWSALNNITGWTPGVGQSDFQDLPDGGVVRGIAGGEFGVIFQDNAIRRMIYAPGNPVIFQIDRVVDGQGLYAPYSVARAGKKVFFYGTGGFYKIEAGGLPQQIGRERVDRTFFSDLSRDSLQFFIGTGDPRTSRVYWAYRSVNAPSGVFDKLIGYDDALDRWFPASVTGEYLLGISQNGLTLEDLDQLSASIDALVPSLDSFAVSVSPELACFNTDHRLGYFRGDYLEARLETPEQGTDGRRLKIRGMRPVTDAPQFYGSLSYRETAGSSAVYMPEIARNTRTGQCDLLKSTRYSRFAVRIPAGQNWSFIAGVEPDVSLVGKR